MIRGFPERGYWGALKGEEEDEGDSGGEDQG